MGEIPFWQEYHRRYNFIAVDYLLYTYEVVQNIHESYPLPLLIGCILGILFLGIKYTVKTDAYKLTFNSKNSLAQKLPIAFFIF
ncbi:MAG TPA: sulfatase, partial [Tenacibaculum sp.]|nr:sulfatase [Tenacibaculum sp.]